MIEETLLEAEDKMDKAIDVAREDFGDIRSGRANAGMFEKILVEYYGAMTPLQQPPPSPSPRRVPCSYNPSTVPRWTRWRKRCGIPTSG